MVKITFICEWCGHITLLNRSHIPFFGRKIKLSRHDPFCSADCNKASILVAIMAKTQVRLGYYPNIDTYVNRIRGKTVKECLKFFNDQTHQQTFTTPR